MSEDVTFWVVMAAGALVVVGVPGWLLWIWALFRTRGDLWLVVQLSGARAPYPRRPVRGLLRVTRERVTWGAYWGAGGLDLGSTGLQALYPRPVTPRDRTNQSVALVCRDGRGTPVTVRVHPVFVDRVMTVLVDRPLPAQPEPPAVRRSRPTVTSVLPLLLIAAGVAVSPSPFGTAATASSARRRSLSPFRSSWPGQGPLRWHYGRDGWPHLRQGRRSSLLLPLLPPCLGTPPGAS